MKQCGEDLFDKTFDFDRQLKDKIAYANILKNGSLEQRKQLKVTNKISDNSLDKKLLISNLANEITNGKFPTIDDMISTVDNLNIFELLLTPTSEPEPQNLIKKKKRKNRSLDKSLSR